MNLEQSLTTKELSRELGLLEKISLKSLTPTPITTCSNSIMADAPLDMEYIIVIDFESTCWDRLHAKKSIKSNQRNSIPPEIIEFPAVLMKLSTGEIEEEFQQYVIPVENPKLSDFCTQLTGITQDQVEKGVPLKTALWTFSQWLSQVTEKKHLRFHASEKGNGPLCIVVTWTDWDLNICLPNECCRKGVVVPPVLREWVDLKAIYKDWYGRQPRGLKNALEDVGLVFEGREHSGLIDARNTAKLAKHLVHDGAILHLSTAAM